MEERVYLHLHRIAAVSTDGHSGEVLHIHHNAAVSTDGHSGWGSSYPSHCHRLYRRTLGRGSSSPWDCRRLYRRTIGKGFSSLSHCRRFDRQTLISIALVPSLRDPARSYDPRRNPLSQRPEIPRCATILCRGAERLLTSNYIWRRYCLSSYLSVAGVARARTSSSDAADGQRGRTHRRGPD